MKRDSYLSELEILKSIAETLNESTELKSMLEDCLRKLLQLTSLEAGWIFLINGEGEYELAAAESLPPALSNPKHQALTQGDCWCVSRFRNGTLTKASNIMECKRLENARLGNWGDTYGLVYHATVPLKAGEELLRVIELLEIADAFVRRHGSKRHLRLMSSLSWNPSPIKSEQP